MVGHIKVDRKILDWGWYQDIKVFHFFLYLLLKANHKEGYWKGVKISRGQVVIGREKAALDTGLTENEIRTCVKKLILTNEKTSKSTNKFTIITICKYGHYQDGNYAINQQINQQINQPLTNNSPTINQPLTTNNNGNNDNKDNKVFINMAKSENFNGLPDIKSGSVIQLFKITKQTDVSNEDVNGLWSIFKTQNLNGKKYYEDEDAVYSHFINWCKTQKIEKNGTDKTRVESAVRSNPKSAGQYELLERIKKSYGSGK